MVNFAKKVQKKAAQDLAGEPILDARVVQPAGLTMRNAILAGVTQQAGALIGSRVAQWQAERSGAERQAIEDAGGMAVHFPTDKCFFTLTDRRVLVHSFAAMSGNPKDLLATYGLADFAGMDAEQGKLVSKLTLYFADGSSMPLDVMKGGGDPQALVEAFNGALAALDG